MSESILAQLKYRPKAVCLCVLTILHNHACYVRWGSLWYGQKWCTLFTATIQSIGSLEKKTTPELTSFLTPDLPPELTMELILFFQVIHVMINMVTLSLSTKSWCTLCLKKGPTCKLSVTLSNLNRFSKFLHCWKAYKIRHKTNTHLTLGMLLHYLGKMGNWKFKFSADIQQIWKIMQTNCILSVSILIPPRV